MNPSRQHRTEALPVETLDHEQALRCHLCKEVIGVYEPLVRFVDGHAHVSSRALDPGSSDREGDYYHRACFERLDGHRPHAD